MASHDDDNTIISSQSNPSSSDYVDERSEQPTPPNDGVKFAMEVKDAFYPDQTDKFAMFLEIVKDFKEKRVDRHKTMAKAKELLAGRPKLISGFNIILQYQDKIDVDQALKEMLGNDWYEVGFLKRDNDRCDLDRMLQDVRSFSKEAEDLLDSIKEKQIEVEIPFRIEEYFTTGALNCMNVYYGDRFLDWMNKSRSYPVLGLNHVLERLKQRQLELRRCIVDFDKAWAEIYADNAIAHHSSFLNCHCTEYEYCDFSIHEHLHKIVQSGLEEIWRSREQIDKSMSFWTTFLHPILGINPSDQFHDEERKPSRVFFGDHDFYMFFQFHRALYEIISSDRSNSKDPGGSNLYAKFIGLLHGIMKGSANNIKFKYGIRDLFRSQSYALFIWDKLAYRLLLQLLHVTIDKKDLMLVELYNNENSREGGELKESVYVANVRALLQEKDIYRFKFMYTPCRLSIQLLDEVTENRVTDEIVSCLAHELSASRIRSDD